jgi:hypothetical protein
VGYAGCDTYDRCTTWDGSPGGRGVVRTVLLPTANISYVVVQNGFHPLDPTPDWEGMVFYAKARPFS